MNDHGTGKPEDKSNLYNQCGLLLLRRASRAASKLYAGILEHADLDPSHFGILSSIKQFGPISISELANKADLDRTTVSRNLKPLIDKKLVTLADTPKGRTRVATITEEGKHALAAAIPRWTNAQQELRELVGDKDMNTLIEILNRIYVETQSREAGTNP
jgi:DNA-binding MarR family transcriptional regulator